MFLNKKLKPITEGSTLLLMTLVILAAMLIISLSVGAITSSGLRAGITQVHSTKAYYAAEAGAERILWEIRKNGDNRTPENMGVCQGEPSYCDCDYSDVVNGMADICFTTSCGSGEMNECDKAGCSTGYNLQTLSNLANYNITYFYDDPDVIIKSFGKYNDVNRVIELRY